MEDPLDHDTSKAVAALQARILRRMTGEERLKLAMEMSLAARAFSTARLRHEHPDWSDSELKRELLRYAFPPGPLPAAIL